MTIIEAPSTNLWRVLAGRGPDRPLPADGDLWERVRDRLNPAKARPTLRDGVEFVALESFRVGPYVMVRSPDPEAAPSRRAREESAYARLTPEEAELARHMDGSRTVAQLVGEFAKMTGRLAPDQVQRVVADLAGGRMLADLPIDAFERVRKIRRGPWPVRFGRAMLRGMGGRRMVIAHPDRAVGVAYRFGGRLLFTRVGAAVMVLTALAGFGVFVRSFGGGAHSAFLFDDSYLLGAVFILGLNALGLLFHEAGHALGTRHAGRRVGGVGFLLFFGIPSAFVDTTDMWMAGRKHRLIASGAGPGFALAFAGAAQVAGFLYPPFAPIAFKLAFAWYLNTLFNLNPLMTLDGYYLFMDGLEVPGLRAKGMAFTVAAVKRPRILLQKHTGEARLVARYAAASTLWMVVTLAMLYGIFKQRYLSMALALWHTGPAAQLLIVFFAFLLVSPLVFTTSRGLLRIPGRVRERLARRDLAADFPFRLQELAATRLGSLPGAALDELARSARWTRPRRGAEVLAAGASPPGVIVVINGALEGRRPGDRGGHLRARAREGELVGVAHVLLGSASSLQWTAVGTRLLTIPAAVFAKVVGPLVRTPPPTDKAEIENLLDESPAFAAVGEDARLVLVSRARPVDVEPGQRFRVKEGYAVLVGSGVVGTIAGEARRGDLIGPPSGDPMEAQARTRARVWSIAAVGGLGPFLGRAAERQARLISHVSPEADAHGDGMSAPLTLPWGSPPPDREAVDAADERLAAGMLRILVGLVLLALLALWFATSNGDAWAEIPTDTAVLEVTRGTVDAVIDGDEKVLERGDKAVVAEIDSIDVRRRSLAQIGLRGGGIAVLCPETRVTVGQLESHGVSPVEPSAGLVQRNGKVIVTTDADSSEFAPLEMVVTLVLDPLAEPPETQQVENEKAAEFATTPASVEVDRGDVLLDGRLVPPRGGELNCGDGAGGVPVVSTSDTTTAAAATTTTIAPVEETTTTAGATVTTRRPRATATTAPPDDGGGTPDTTSDTTAETTPATTPDTTPATTPATTPSPTSPPCTLEDPRRC